MEHELKNKMKKIYKICFADGKEKVDVNADGYLLDTHNNLVFYNDKPSQYPGTHSYDVICKIRTWDLVEIVDP